MTVLSQFLSALQLQSNIVLISVHAVRGSVPREVGAWMAVCQDHTTGTIGGGRLEWDATAYAKELLAQEPVPLPHLQPQRRLYRLGPSLGQCCGGEVELQFERVSSADADVLRERLQPAYPTVALFGGGHVGHAIVQVLGTLDWPIVWIDSRDEVFPENMPDSVQCEHSEPVYAAVPALPSGSMVLIMSFSHAEDLDIVAACLARQRDRGDLPFIGLIGSKTKWASFRSRLVARGFSESELAKVTSPIGIAGIGSKRPEAIAIGVAAQLLLLQSQT